MLIHSAIAERMFGAHDALVPAIKLTALPGIYVDYIAEKVDYYHLLFDRHEVIWADGAPTESLYTGPEAMKAISPAARAEILALFPEIEQADHAPVAASFMPCHAKQKRLIARHAKNSKPLLSGLTAPSVTPLP